MEAVTLVEQVYSKPRFSPWLIWGVGAAFFFAEYYARVAPSVMAHDLMAAFSINAFALGTLSAFFNYAYVPMQLPVGMMMDRYGAHKLLTATTLICAVGAFSFAYAPNLFTAYAGRLLIGFGSAFAFVGSLKLASIWFPARRFGLMAGLTQAIGMLGAFFGQGPLSVLVDRLGWHHTMQLIAMTFIALAIAAAVIVRDKPRASDLSMDKPHSPGLFTSLSQVMKNPQSWYNAIYAGLIYAPTAAFAEMWGVSFLRSAYHVDLPVAAAATGMIFLGWGIGGPASGWLSDKVGRRKPLMYASAAAGLITLLLIIYVKLPLPLLYTVLFLYGFTNTGVAISYAVASEINPPSISGTSMALANMASVIIGTIFQPVIGALLVWHWGGIKVDGIPYYTAADYRSALVILPLCSLLSFFSVRFIRETFCRSGQHAAQAKN